MASHRAKAQRLGDTGSHESKAVENYKAHGSHSQNGHLRPGPVRSSYVQGPKDVQGHCITRSSPCINFHRFPAFSLSDPGQWMCHIKGSNQGWMTLRSSREINIQYNMILYSIVLPIAQFQGCTSCTVAPSSEKRNGYPIYRSQSVSVWIWFELSWFFLVTRHTHGPSATLARA